MNSSRSYIYITLFIAIIVAVVQLFSTFFVKTPDKETSALAGSQILPSSLNLDTVTLIDERATKYLPLQYSQLEIGELPTGTPSVTPSVTPTP